jgi:predicted dehydrogenase
MSAGIGVVGLGRLGQVRVRALARRVEHARLVAVTDIDHDLAVATGGRYGCAVAPSVAELVARPDIDGVVVATPTALHVAPVEAVVAAGKALFCEKPLASTLVDHLHLVGLIDASGIACQIGFNRRLDPDFLDARRRIAAGVIGRPTYLRSVMRDPFPPPVWARDPALGGGLFVDMLIHDYDSARMLMGEEITAVYAQAANLVIDAEGIRGFADNATVALEFASGAMGQLHSAMHAVYGYDVRAEVFGEKGSIEIGSRRRHDIVVSLAGVGVTEPDTFLPEGDIPHAMFRFGEAYEAEMVAFADVVNGVRPAPVDHHDALAAFRVADAARRSAAERRRVDLSEIAAS